MIRSDFLALLKKHTAAERAHWRGGVYNPHSGFLRTGEVGDILCPLTYVCWKEHGDGHRHKVPQFKVAGRTLGLPDHEIDAIMQAADKWPSCDWGLRAKLFDAVGPWQGGSRMDEAMTRGRFLDLLAHHNAAYHCHPHMGNNGKGPPHWWMYSSGEIRAGVDAACPVT